MEYKIITSSSNIMISSEVKESIENDWIPQGGVSVVSDAVGVRFFQAMVKIN
jgi:hypothetical protein